MSDASDYIITVDSDATEAEQIVQSSALSTHLIASVARQLLILINRASVNEYYSD